MRMLIRETDTFRVVDRGRALRTAGAGTKCPAGEGVLVNNRLFFISLCFLLLLVHSPVSAAGTALVRSDSPTSAEGAVSLLLLQHGYGVTYIPISEASLTNLSGYSNVVFVENYATLGGETSSGTINGLLANGTNVLLLYASPFMLDSRFDQDSPYYNLYIDSNTTFLTDYDNNTAFPAITSGPTIFLPYGYLLNGWTSLGELGGGSNEHSAFYYSGTSSGRGAILGYDPEYYTGEGSVVFEKALRYVTGTNSLTPVPPGQVAFLITNYTSDTFTSEETTVSSLLESKGYTIYPVSAYNRTFTDYSGALFVVQAENFGPTMNSYYNNLLRQGTNVLLLYASPFVLDSRFDQDSPYYNLYIDSNTTFLTDYDNNTAFPAITSGPTIFLPYGYLLNGWTSLGELGGGSNEHSAFYYSGTGSGRGAILGYDPEYYTGEGSVVFEKALRYVTGTNSLTPVPPGQVAFLIANYTSDTFTSEETTISSLLESKGYTIYPVSAYNRTFTDYSGALFVVQAENFGPTMNSYYNSLLSHGTNVLLLYASPFVLDSRFDQDSPYYNLYVDSNTAFLSGYNNDTTVPVITSGSTVFLPYGYILNGWTFLGELGGGSTEHSAFYYSGTGSGRGAILGYDPQHYSSADGNSIFTSATSYVATGVSSGPPTSNFTVTPTSGTAPLTVQFNDTSTNSPTSWNWSFGDGSYSDIQNVTHTYTVAGTYTISLNVTNAEGSNVTAYENNIAVDFTSISMFRGNRIHTGLYDNGGIQPTANLAWKSATGAGIKSSPVIDGNTLYIGSADGKLYAINKTDGSPVWNTSIGINIDSVPCIADGTVYIGSWDKNVYALNASNGSVLWSYPTGNYITSSPAAANGIIYVGSHDGTAYALRASSGDLFWSYATGSEISSSPAIANGLVYIGSGNTAVYALNATTGAFVWNATLAGQVVSSPAVENGVVYVGSYNNGIFALNATTGATLWEYTGTGSIESSPAVSNGAVFVGSDDNNTYAIDAATGIKLWNYTTGGTVISSPAVANGTVFVGSNDGSVYAFNASSGTMQWEYTIGSPVESSPSIASGLLYIGSNDGYVYALGGTPPAPIASFTTNITSGTVPLTVQFNDTSTNSPTSWNWSFTNVTGNNTVIWWSSSEFPVQTFGAGNFSIALNASNSAGYSVSTQSTFINVTSTGSAPAQTSAPVITTPVFVGATHVNGTAVPGSSVVLTVNGMAQTAVTASAPNGAWSVDVPTLATTDTISVTAQATGELVSSSATANIISVNADGTFSTNVTSAVNTATNITCVSVTGTGTGINQLAVTSTVSSASPVSQSAPGTVFEYIVITATAPNTYSISTAQISFTVQQSWLTANQLTPQNITLEHYDGTTWQALPTTFAGNDINGEDHYTATTTSFSPFAITWQAANATPLVAPIVSFTATPATGTAPLAVQFTDTSTGGPVNWIWNFGDGNTSSAENPSHTFVQTQVFNVILTVNGSDGLTNSSTEQVTVYTPQTTVSTQMNGTTASTVNGNQTLVVTNSTIESTGGTVTSTGTTLTVQNASSFWQSAQVFAQNVSYNITTSDYTVQNVTQVVMQSTPVTAVLNQSIGNVSVSLGVALNQYMPDTSVGVAITQGANASTMQGFQLAAQNSSITVKNVAYTVQFTNTAQINANLVNQTTNTTQQPVVITMSVNDTWVSQQGGTGTIAIIRYPELGDPQVLKTWFDHYDASTNMDWFEADSPNGLSIFGLVEYAAQQAASSQQVVSGPRGPDSNSPGGRNGGNGNPSPAASVAVPQAVPSSLPAPTQVAPPISQQQAAPQTIVVSPATLPVDSSGQLTTSLGIQSPDKTALLTLPAGVRATDSAGQTISEVRIRPLDSSLSPSTDDASIYTLVGPVYLCGPDGAHFAPAITLTVTLTASQWASVNANGVQPVIRSYSPSTRSWTTLATQSDAGTMTLSASVTHFTDFAVFTQQPVSAPTEATPLSAPTDPYDILLSMGVWVVGVLEQNPIIAAICGVLLCAVPITWRWYRRKTVYDRIFNR